MLSRLWKKTIVRRVAYSALILATLLSPLCWYFGITSGNDVLAYAGMAKECHPVWKDLALHRVYEGQSAEDVIATTKPISIVRYGRFVVLGYEEEPLSFTVVRIIAIDGKLVQAFAGSCTWDHTFFDSLTAAQSAEMSNAYDGDDRTVVYNGKLITQ